VVTKPLYGLTGMARAMITRFNPPFRSQVPPQWRGACAAVAGGGPNRATAIVVARLVFTISGQSRAFTALRLIDLVTASHSHMNELATLEFALQQLARLEDELAPDGAVPGPLMLALSSRTRIGTVDRANAIAAATLPAEAQRRLTVMPIEITTGYRRPDGQWPPRCPVAWLVHEFNARVASHVETPDPHDRRLGPDSPGLAEVLRQGAHLGEARQAGSIGPLDAHAQALALPGGRPVPPGV